jgi:hypothetical protein
MTTNSATWFYRTPEKSPYLLAERVRTTFWDERFGGLWLDTVRAEAPFVMQGLHNGARVQMEWEPARWMRLSTAPASPALAQGLANILRRRPSVRYEDPQGHTVWEWWLEAGEADRRWQEIQGKPAYGNPARLDRAS